LAPVEEQRLAVVAFHAFDFADEDGVITGRVFADNVAGQFGQRAFEQGNSGRGPTITNAEEGVIFGRLLAFGEMLGERLLSRAEDADAKAALRFQEGEKPRVVVYADEHEKRIEGDGGEGIGCHAMHHAGLALHCNNGDARGECARDAAKRYGIERRGGHGSFFSR
jgi:hypothetical protein